MYPRRCNRRRSTCKRSRAQRRYRPALEILENRLAPAVITVTTAADDNTANDGSVSLREAIQAMNNASAGSDMDISHQNPGVFGVNDTINFNISAAGTVQTINVGSTGNGPLPALNVPMTINGYSEPGASANTLANGDNAKILIELNGLAVITGTRDGFLVGATGAGSTIEGLCINRFVNGIELRGGGDTVTGNFVGTNSQGNAAEANQGDGILVNKCSRNTIGGMSPGDRNVVSSNNVNIHIVGLQSAPATENIVEGNFVGVSASGTGQVGPGGGFFGIEIEGGNANTIGGNTMAARNVIGLNGRAGIELANGAENNIVQGNYIGVGADGLTNVGNGDGISLISNLFQQGPVGEPPLSGNVIGLNPHSGFSGLYNLIEFNGGGGISLAKLAQHNMTFQNSGNSILGNSIFENGSLGIDLGADGLTPNDSQGHSAPTDPNNYQNFPVLNSAVVSPGQIAISGTMDQSVSPNVQYRIEFFSSQPVGDPVPQGQSFLGAITVTTDGNGHASFNVSLPTTLNPLGSYVFTATATNLTPDPSAQPGAVNVFNTSEFSVGIPIRMAFGADAGSTPLVKVWEGTVQQGGFYAFDPRFKGGVRVAVGDVNGDGIPDIIAAAGPGGGPHVKIIDGTKLSMVDANGEIDDAALLGQFYAYDPAFSGGVFVAFGRVSGKAPEIITGAGAGGTPHVKVIDATKLSQLDGKAEIADSALVAQFLAYSPSFSGGVSVAAVNLFGVIDIVTGAGPGGGPHVKVIDGTKLDQLQNDSVIADTVLIGQFYAGSPFDNDGVFVAAYNNNNGRPIIVTSHAVGSGPVQVIDGLQLNQLDSNSQPTGTAVLGSFFAYDPHDPTMGTNAHIAITDFNGDGYPDILIGPSQTQAPEPVLIVDGAKMHEVGPFQEILPSAILLDNFFGYGSNYAGGIFVGGQ